MRSIAAALVTAAVICTQGAAQSVPSMGTLGGFVAFDGSGTLGAFTGTTTQVTGALVGAASIEAVKGWWRVRVHPDRVSFRGKTPMTITDYRIGGLSKALGLLKMKNEIVVRVEVVWSKG